jgi:glycosyltransferase involved in cell wall biosynthesis
MVESARSSAISSFDPFNSVSVVVPVYNGAKYIRETLESILSQTVQPAEIIVVNDGSTDATGSIVMEYGNPVTLINISNRGASAARNYGVAKATSEWIALCDADDLWLPKKLEMQLRLASECPEISYVITDYTEIANGERSKRSHFSYAPSDFWVKEQYSTGFVVRKQITGKLTTFQPSITSTVLVKRKLYENVEGFDELVTNSAEDTCFHFRCLSVVPFGVVPEVLMLYRRHPESWSADGLKQLRNTLITWTDIIQRYPGAQPFREELLKGLADMRQELRVTERYHKRQKIKRFLGLGE